MKSSGYWCTACGLPELPVLGLFKIRTSSSTWFHSGVSLSLSRPSQLAWVFWLTSYLCVDMKGLETAPFCLFILSCFVIWFLWLSFNFFLFARTRYSSWNPAHIHQRVLWLHTSVLGAGKGVKQIGEHAWKVLCPKAPSSRVCWEQTG